MQMKLHLGCFDQPYEGWINTDITPHIWIARIPGAAALLHTLGLLPKQRFTQHQAGIFRQISYLNVTKKFPYASNYMNAVFCSHLLEHVHLHAIPHLLQEVLRVLKPGGIFRVVVPDLAQCLELYDRHDPARFLEVVFEHDHTNPKNSHQWMYTDISLQETLRQHGFTNTEILAYGRGRCPDLDRIDNRPEESIYVEGQKPY